jgi:hypothetical protein
MIEIRNFLISIWPKVYKLIQEFIYFLINLVKTFFRIVKEEIIG